MNTKYSLFIKIGVFLTAAVILTERFIVKLPNTLAIVLYLVAFVLCVLGIVGVAKGKK